ncbi:heterochromatin protein 1-like [Culex pipiens pallens]|uniref:heterochromatin protein 1-like n=1 Tax=Culex pipiens pallens TaxID=42434 RepID=UPI00195485B8|nr:heterochromatin protein 1-like [Culex pipiens pallens]
MVFNRSSGSVARIPKTPWNRRKISTARIFWRNLHARRAKSGSATTSEHGSGRRRWGPSGDSGQTNEGQKRIQKGYVAEKLEGVPEEDGERTFLVRWKGVDEVELVQSRMVRLHVPALVIYFYESRIINAAKISVQ